MTVLLTIVLGTVAVFLGWLALRIAFAILAAPFVAIAAERWPPFTRGQHIAFLVIFLVFPAIFHFAFA
jgi:hypothetical protein